MYMRRPPTGPKRSHIAGWLILVTIKAPVSTTSERGNYTCLDEWWGSVACGPQALTTC